MNAKTMWEQYATRNDISAEYDAWCFGDNADALADLVLKGIKTATASAYPLYELEGEELPIEGQYSVVLWKDDTAACIIKTTKVYTTAFCDVPQSKHIKKGKGTEALHIGELCIVISL